MKLIVMETRCRFAIWRVIAFVAVVKYNSLSRDILLKAVKDDAPCEATAVLFE